MIQEITKEQQALIGREAREYILCAAIWYKDIEPHENFKGHIVNVNRGIVILGVRHGNCIITLMYLTGLRTVTYGVDSAGEHIQGFLTSKGRFVDRKEAGKIAFKTGQIEEETDLLFSEDLY